MSAVVVAAFALAAPGGAAAQLPGDPTGLLPGDPTGLLPGCVEGELPALPECLPGGGDLPGGLPGDLPIDLPGGDPGTGPGGAGPGGSTGTGDTGGATGPTIAGPSKAPTVRVDSRGRFRVGGVVVTCPAGCRLSAKVRGADGTSFVTRTFDLRPGASLQLKKLKVSKKALKALRRAGVARVTARLKASPLTGPSVAREVGLKLKPAKR